MPVQNQNIWESIIVYILDRHIDIINFFVSIQIFLAMVIKMSCWLAFKKLYNNLFFIMFA